MIPRARVGKSHGSPENETRFWASRTFLRSTFGRGLRGVFLPTLTAGAALAVLLVLTRKAETPSLPAAGNAAPPSVTSLVEGKTTPFALSPPNHALSPLQQLPLDPALRAEALQRLLATISGPQIQEALIALHAEAPSETTTELSLRLVRKWAEAAPAAAADWVAQLPVGPLRAEALDQVAIVWANQALENAAAWARLLPPADRPRALGSIAQEAVRTVPVKALQFALELPAAPLRDGLIRRAVAEWVTTDPEKAVAWARQLPDDTLRDEVLAATATAWSDHDPSAAATLAATELPSGRLQADTVVSIVQRWAQQNPDRAAAWVQTFPENDLRWDAIENLEVTVAAQGLKNGKL
jgi:hypothetical protein